jgi:hypothetical protein
MAFVAQKPVLYEALGETYYYNSVYETFEEYSSEFSTSSASSSNSEYYTEGAGGAGGNNPFTRSFSSSSSFEGAWSSTGYETSADFSQNSAGRHNSVNNSYTQKEQATTITESSSRTLWHSSASTLEWYLYTTSFANKTTFVVPYSTLTSSTSGSSSTSRSGSTSKTWYYFSGAYTTIEFLPGRSGVTFSELFVNSTPSGTTTSETSGGSQTDFDNTHTYLASTTYTLSYEGNDNVYYRTYKTVTVASVDAGTKLLRFDLEFFVAHPTVEAVCLYPNQQTGVVCPLLGEVGLFAGSSTTFPEGHFYNVGAALQTYETFDAIVYGESTSTFFIGDTLEEASATWGEYDSVGGASSEDARSTTDAASKVTTYSTTRVTPTVNEATGAISPGYSYDYTADNPAGDRYETYVRAVQSTCRRFYPEAEAGVVSVPELMGVTSTEAVAYPKMFVTTSSTSGSGTTSGTFGTRILAAWWQDEVFYFVGLDATSSSGRSFTLSKDAGSTYKPPRYSYTRANPPPVVGGGSPAYPDESPIYGDTDTIYGDTVGPRYGYGWFSWAPPVVVRKVALGGMQIPQDFSVGGGRYANPVFAQTPSQYGFAQRPAVLGPLFADTEHLDGTGVAARTQTAHVWGVPQGAQAGVVVGGNDAPAGWDATVVTPCGVFMTASYSGTESGPSELSSVYLPFTAQTTQVLGDARTVWVPADYHINKSSTGYAPWFDVFWAGTPRYYNNTSEFF